MSDKISRSDIEPIFPRKAGQTARANEICQCLISSSEKIRKL